MNPQLDRIHRIAVIAPLVIYHVRKGITVTAHRTGGLPKCKTVLYNYTLCKEYR